MLRKANVLLLDEPTNHLDLMSREVLEAALDEYEGTLIFVSHDRYFLNRIADRIVELSPDGTENFLGNYDEMVAKKQEMKEWLSTSLNTANSQAAQPAVSDYEADKQAKRDERARQRKREQSEADISRLEKELSELELAMASSEMVTDYMKLREKQAEAEKTRAALEEAYQTWEALMEE
jgi:ATP-binding cassette subfamily F protein 3